MAAELVRQDLGGAFVGSFMFVHRDPEVSVGANALSFVPLSHCHLGAGRGSFVGEKHGSERGCE